MQQTQSRWYWGATAKTGKRSPHTEMEKAGRSALVVGSLPHKKQSLAKAALTLPHARPAEAQIGLNGLNLWKYTVLLFLCPKNKVICDFC